MLTLSIWLTGNTTYTVRWWFKGTYVNSSSCAPLSVAMLEGFFSRFWTITPYIKSEMINKKAKFWYRFYYHFCKREADKLWERVVWNLTNNDPGLGTCTEDVLSWWQLTICLCQLLFQQFYSGKDELHWMCYLLVLKTS